MLKKKNKKLTKKEQSMLRVGSQQNHQSIARSNCERNKMIESGKIKGGKNI